MAKVVFGSSKNMVGKGENAGNQHFLLFRQGFQKTPFSGLTLQNSMLCFKDPKKEDLKKQCGK